VLAGSGSLLSVARAEHHLCMAVVRAASVTAGNAWRLGFEQSRIGGNPMANGYSRKQNRHWMRGARSGLDAFATRGGRGVSEGGSVLRRDHGRLLTFLRFPRRTLGASAPRSEAPRAGRRGWLRRPQLLGGRWCCLGQGAGAALLGASLRERSRSWSPRQQSSTAITSFAPSARTPVITKVQAARVSGLRLPTDTPNRPRADRAATKRDTSAASSPSVA
jgi:hypothetical protein